MTTETHHVERKSLLKVTGKTADWIALAHDCVCFANGAGGTLHIGIEDRADGPPADQRIDPLLLDTIRKRVRELTVNVNVLPTVEQHANGGEYIALAVPRAQGVASTSDGRYFMRVGDSCHPITGDNVMRLADERPAIPWENMTSLGVARADADPRQVKHLVDRLRGSDRVKTGVKEKSDEELLRHYGLATRDTLTNLGVLLVGRAADRARLGTAPIIQAIKYDERGIKVDKWTWDDHALSPIDLADAIWAELPDFRESYELPDGMLRTKVPAFEEAVVRELLVNALVHRPYTQRGDIFLNLHPDRLEVVNAGRLPLGVTPRNILHESRRRNEGLARVFHDVNLMEREGTGIDLLFERLLMSGRTPPRITERTDAVHVEIPRRVVRPGVIRLLAEADRRYKLKQSERIALGLIAQTEGLLASELAKELELAGTGEVHRWVDRLVEVGLVQQTGRTKATRYFVPPELLRMTGLDQLTTLSRVQPHRLRALILEDLDRYPDSSKGEIHRRVGPEISERTFSRELQALVLAGKVGATGQTRARRFRLIAVSGQEPGRGP